MFCVWHWATGSSSQRKTNERIQKIAPEHDKTTLFLLKKMDYKSSREGKQNKSEAHECSSLWWVLEVLANRGCKLLKKLLIQN